jgi:2-methylcitrate dehydratase PrpD
MKKWVTKELVEYTVSTSYENYPGEVIEKTKLLILDNIGCALGGSRSPIGKAVLDPFRNMGGSEEATVIGGGVKVPCIQAAFVNGTMANALDFDDAYLAIGHPGSSIIPAALSIGEWKKTSGDQIINAIITAYDVGSRIGLAIQPTYERLQNVWGVGTWQTFSAVVAAAKTLDLDFEQMLNAFGVAGATAPLPNTQKWGWDIAERPIHWVKEPTGWPCWTGTLAAILSANGFIGNRYILDGENGFWIMAGSDQCDYDKMTQGLGKEFVVMNDMSFKPYSCCRWQHAALDCIREIKQEYSLLSDDVKEIVIHSFAWVKSQEAYDLQSVVDGQFCMPYTAYMVLQGFPPGPGWYAEEHLNNEAIADLARKVKIFIDPAMDRVYFETDEVSARVEVITQTGETYTKFIDIPRGDPRNPLTREEVEEKFKTQASYVLNEEDIFKSIEIINNFEKLDNISELMVVLAGAR